MEPWVFRLWLVLSVIWVVAVANIAEPDYELFNAAHNSGIALETEVSVKQVREAAVNALSAGDQAAFKVLPERAEKLEDQNTTAAAQRSFDQEPPTKAEAKLIQDYRLASAREDAAVALSFPPISLAAFLCIRWILRGFRASA